MVPDSDLNAAEHAFLRGYLTLHAADLERAAGPDATPVSFAIAPGESAAAVARLVPRLPAPITAAPNFMAKLLWPEATV